MDWLFTGLCAPSPTGPLYGCTSFGQGLATVLVGVLCFLAAFLAGWLVWRLLRVIFWPNPLGAVERRHRAVRDAYHVVSAGLSRYGDNDEGINLLEWLDNRIKNVAPDRTHPLLLGQKFWTREEIEAIAKSMRGTPTPGDVRSLVAIEVKRLLTEQGLIRRQPKAPSKDYLWAPAAAAPARTPDPNSFG